MATPSRRAPGRRQPPVHRRWPDLLPSRAAASKARGSGSSPPELFPLPLIEAPTSFEKAPLGSSRCVRKSTNLRRHTRDDANRSLWALNALYGCESPSLAPPSDAQKAVQHRALAIAREASHAHTCTSPQEAFRELLGPRCDYNGESTTVEPYDRSRLSLPPAGGLPVPLDSVLDSDSAELLNGFARSQFLLPSERERACSRCLH